MAMLLRPYNVRVVFPDGSEEAPDEGAIVDVEITHNGARFLTEAFITQLRYVYGSNWMVRSSTRYGDGPLEIEADGSIVIRLYPHQKQVMHPGGCKKCGQPGKFIRTALMCPKHGMIGGF